MAKITQPKGAIGFRKNLAITVAPGTKLKTETFTPEESDIHDISKEGIIITHMIINQYGTGGGAGSFIYYLSLFNRTSNASWAYRDASAFNIAWVRNLLSSVGAEWIRPIILDLTSMPGGGIGLIADFIAFTMETDINVGSNTAFELEFWYNWIDVDSDSYRRLLYQRSI